MSGRFNQRLRRLEAARQAARARRRGDGGASRAVVMTQLAHIRARRSAMLTPEQRAAWEAHQAAMTSDDHAPRLAAVVASLRAYQQRMGIPTP